MHGQGLSSVLLDNGDNNTVYHCLYGLFFHFIYAILNVQNFLLDVGNVCQLMSFTFDFRWIHRLPVQIKVLPSASWTLDISLYSNNKRLVQ